MCGIAGCYGGRDIETIKRMLNAMEHRGPDDRGIHTFNNTVLGHTRLSIVDVAGGHQPILSNGGHIGIICNGEIYNFRELKERLEYKYDFTTNTDTEVILHLYQERGAECLKELSDLLLGQSNS